MDSATGGSIAVLGGLVFPNGLEATRDGKVFSSETSPGFGDWCRQKLYATNRSRLFRIEVGIDGRHVLASGR